MQTSKLQVLWKKRDRGAVEKPVFEDLRLPAFVDTTAGKLRYARNDTETHFLSLRGAKRRSNLDFFNSPTGPNILRLKNQSASRGSSFLRGKKSV